MDKAVVYDNFFKATVFFRYILITRGSDANSLLNVSNRKKFYSLVLILTFSLPSIRFVQAVMKESDDVRILLELDTLLI